MSLREIRMIKIKSLSKQEIITRYNCSNKANKTSPIIQEVTKL